MAKKGKESINKEKKPDQSSENEKEISEEKEDKDAKVKPIYVAPSQEIRDIIDKHIEMGKQTKRIIEDAIRMYDNYSKMDPKAQAILDKYEEEYGSKIAEIEDAMKLLEAQKDPAALEVEKERDLWSRSRDEMKMMLIGKTTFNQLIRAAAEAPKKITDRSFKSNVALAIINWITSKSIKTLSLKDIIEAIKKMWVVANYFYIIEVKKETEETEEEEEVEEKEEEYLITFKHRQLLDYSNYWLGYFTELFTSNAFSFGCMIVDSEAYDEFFTLTIKKIYDKHDLEIDFKELSLEDCVLSIKELYVKAKLFTKIDIKPENEGFLLTMKHNKNKHYSSFWLDTFMRLFSSDDFSFKCLISGEAFDETLSLTLKIGYDKE